MTYECLSNTLTEKNSTISHLIFVEELTYKCNNYEIEIVTEITIV